MLCYSGLHFGLHVALPKSGCLLLHPNGEIEGTGIFSSTHLWGGFTWVQSTNGPFNPNLLAPFILVVQPNRAKGTPRPYDPQPKMASKYPPTRASHVGPRTYSERYGTAASISGDFNRPRMLYRRKGDCRPSLNLRLKLVLCVRS